MTNPNDSVYPYEHTEQAMQDGVSYEVTVPHSGMTKREAFAMAAMQGLISCPLFKGDWMTDGDPVKSIAIRSVQYADALIKALNSKPELSLTETLKTRPA